MLEIRIEKEQLPMIQINFAEIKQNLQQSLELYKGIIVTEETLGSCKNDQKELAGLRIKIDNYRKEKKKELSKPIEAFESQCKELIALVEEAEKPIKAGIEIFDNERRAEKKAAAMRLIAEVIEENSLNEKYAARLDVIDKYCNLTAKEGDIKDDLTNRALLLKAEQDAEAEKLEIITDTIEAVNARLSSKLSITDFTRFINSGAATKDILAEIHGKAELIYNAENKPVKEPEPIPEPIVEPIVEPIKEVAEKACYGVYRVSGTLSQLKAVSNFLKANGITYKVIDQGEVE